MVQVKMIVLSISKIAFLPDVRRAVSYKFIWTSHNVTKDCPRLLARKVDNLYML